MTALLSIHDPFKLGVLARLSCIPTHFFLEKKKTFPKSAVATEKVQKGLKKCPQQGNCAINKIFSCISQGTEGMNTLIGQRAKNISIKVQEFILR